MKILSSAVLGSTLCICGLSFTTQPAQAADGQISFHLSWDSAPQDFGEFKKRGFHDGQNAARWDFDHHMQADVNQHEDYRNPHVPPEFAREYQEGYRHGYDRAVQHFMEQSQPPAPRYEQPAPPPPPPPMHSHWSDFPHDAPPPARFGYVEGVLAGAYDIAAGGPPRIDSHEEFRHPHMPPPAHDSYRYGFRSGYDTAYRNFSTPGDQTRRRGFVEGIAAARRDRDGHMPPNVNAHEELRHPPAPPMEHEDYRDGFRHGYEMASSYIF